MEELRSYSKIIKPRESEETTQYQAKIEKLVEEPMKPVNSAYSSLQEGYNGIENLIEEVVSRNEWLLNSKF